jgi:hypothetical protein
MIGMFGIHQERHLVRPERAFHFQAIHFLRPRPAFRRLEDNHRPARTRGVFFVPRIRLNSPNVLNGLFQGRGHEFVHLFRLVAFHKVRRPAAAAKKLFQFIRLNARQDGRVGNFVAIEMQNRQHRAVSDRIEKFVGLPRGRQRAGFRFAVADNAGDDQIRIVKRRAESVRQRIAQFAAFVNRTRSRRRHMAGNSAGKRKLREQFFQPGFVLRDVG